MSALRAQTRDVFRERVAERVLSSHRRARDARPARSGHRVRAARCSSTDRLETARASWAKASAGCSAAISTCRTPSTSTARSSRCSIPSRTRRTTRDDEDRSSGRTRDIDGRWIRIGRPVITVGGELTLEMLDLRYKRAVDVLRGARAPESQRRRAGRRRLRAPAGAGARPVESMDRAARIARRLPEPALRTEVSGALRRAGGVRHEPRASIARRRGVSAPHPVQDSGEEPVAASSSARIFEMNCRGTARIRSSRSSQHLHDKYYIGRKLEMRACHPRDLTDQVVNLCRYHRRPAELTPDTARRRVPDLFPGRHAERGDGRTMTLTQPLSARACETWSRCLIGALFLVLAWRLLGDFMQTGRATDLLLLVGEALVVVLTCLRRPAIDRRQAPDRSTRHGGVDDISRFSASRRRSRRSFRKPRPRCSLGIGLSWWSWGKDLARIQLRPAASEPRRDGARTLPRS